MYRERVKSWGLDKNLKDREMRAAVRKLGDRVAEGKLSNLYIRGRKTDFQKVVRHWKRKNLEIADVLVLRSMSKTPDGVEWLTPLPSPIMTPEVLAVPERIVRMLRDYHQGSFETGTWRSVGQNIPCQSIKGSDDGFYELGELHQQCMLSCRLFNTNAFDEARRILDRACARVKKVVLTEQPDTFRTLLQISLYTCNYDRPEVGSAILNHSSAMGGIALGDQHPFVLVCQWIASLDLVSQRQNEEVLHRSSEAIYETFEGFLGPLHRTTVASLLERFQTARLSDQCTDYQELALRNLLHECETALGQDDYRTLNVRLELANYRVDRLEYAAAREEAQALVVQEASKTYQIRGLEVLAESLYGLDEIHEALNILRQAIDLAIREWGADDPQTQEMMLRLQSLMEEQGMHESAAQVNEERLRGADYGTESDADDMDTSYDFDVEQI